MKEKKYPLKLLFQELNGNPYRQLNLAFLLIGVVPMLALIYVICNSMMLGRNFFEDVSPIVIISGVIILLGYAAGYTVVQNIINKTLSYAAKAKRADELKSTFAMSLAHDIKNPLHTMKINMSCIEAQACGKLTKEQAGIVNNCDELIDRMNSMLMELIGTYMIESRIEKMNMSHFDLRDLIEKQRRELEVSALAKRMIFSVEVSEKPLTIKADKDKMVRVINNLLNNSIKYTPQGGRITIKAYPAGDFVYMEFLNSGPSIPQDRLEKIFDKFERLSTMEEGHGLGLAIAKDIVERHDGKIWATSEAGKPNCFKVLLALAKESGPAGPKDARKILIIEDDKQFSAALTSYLSGRGYSVLSAYDAAAGIKSARAGGIAAIILDLELPGTDDFFALKSLREFPETINTPIIVSTGKVGEGIEMKVRGMGADDFIQKPYGVEKLFDKLRPFLPA